MSDERLLGALIEKNDQMADAVKEIAIGVSALLQFQAAQTAKNEADKEWRSTVEKHQDKQDERINEINQDFDDFKKTEFREVRDGQRANSLLVNGAMVVVSMIVGGGVTLAVTFIGG